MAVQIPSLATNRVIRVGAIDYEIRRVERLVDTDGVTKLNGQIWHNECVIYLDTSLSPQAERHTLWHEALHAVVRQGGLELNENEIDVLAYGVMQVLRDNAEMRE